MAKRLKTQHSCKPRARPAKQRVPTRDRSGDRYVQHALRRPHTTTTTHMSGCPKYWQNASALESTPATKESPSIRFPDTARSNSDSFGFVAFSVARWRSEGVRDAERLISALLPPRARDAWLPVASPVEAEPPRPRPCPRLCRRRSEAGGVCVARAMPAPDDVVAESRVGVWVSKLNTRRGDEEPSWECSCSASEPPSDRERRTWRGVGVACEAVNSSPSTVLTSNACLEWDLVGEASAVTRLLSSNHASLVSRVKTGGLRSLPVVRWRLRLAHSTDTYTTFSSTCAQ